MDDTDTQPQPEEARSFATFVAMLEDGRLNADLSDKLRDLNAALNDHAMDHGGGKAKGSLTLKVKFTLEKGVFDIVADISTDLPKAPRDRSIAWSTPGNNFTPENPRQGNLFARPRDVTSDDAATMRRV